MLTTVFTPKRQPEPAERHRLTVVGGLAALSLDAMASVACGPEAIVLVLSLAGGAGPGFTLPVTISIAVLLAVLTLPYRQVIAAFPEGGGAYGVARAYLGRRASLVAAASRPAPAGVDAAPALRPSEVVGCPGKARRSPGDRLQLASSSPMSSTLIRIAAEMRSGPEIEFMDTFADRVRTSGIEAAWEPVLGDLAPVIAALVGRDARSPAPAWRLAPSAFSADLRDAEGLAAAVAPAIREFLHGQLGANR